MRIQTVQVRPVAQLSHASAQSLFSSVQHKPWAMLLDTCNNTLSDGRFDIIVYAPVATYQVKQTQQTLQIHDPTYQCLQEVVANGEAFSELNKLHKRFSELFDMREYAQSELPFLLGCLGLFGYDFNVITDRIIDENPSQYLLDDIAVGFYDHSLILDNKTGDVFYVSVEDDDGSWLSPFLDAVKGESAHAKPDKPSIENEQSDFALTSPWAANLSKAQYLSRMAQIDDYLKAGDCYQVNFAQRFSAAYQGCEWQAYQTLTKVNKAPFSSFIRLPQSCVISVSPERFLLVKNNKVVTKPIKGTRKRQQDPIADKQLANDLLASEKDRAENLMIVDLLRNDISKHCAAHSVSVPHLFALESYPAVHHMVSTVVGELKPDSGPFELLAGAFPGGSITGAPKVRAMQIIQELEPDKRSIYCGSIGYVGIRNDMDTNICIRTLLAENGELYCWAGGGIVLDSQATDEYQESFDKVAKILPVLAQTLQEEYAK